MLEQFKIGDLVERIVDSFGNMQIGDKNTIEEFYQDRYLVLKNDTYKYDYKYFKLVNTELEYEIC